MPGTAPAWRQYLRLLRPERADLRTIVIYGAASAVLALAVPLTVDALISNIVFGTLLTPLLVLVGILLGCLTLQALLGMLQAYVAEIVERRIFVRVVSDMAWRLPRVEIAAFDRRYGPELVNRFFDTVTVQKSSSKLLLEVTNLVLTTAVGMTVLCFYHPLLFAFSATVLVALAVLVFVFGIGGVRTAIAESAAKYEVAAWLQEIARHTTAFCTHGGAEFAAQRADRLAADYILQRQRHFKVLFRQIAGSFGLQVAASTAILAAGGWLVIEQQLTPGQLVASELIVTAVAANVTKLGGVLQNWYDVCAASDKLGLLIDLPLERQSGDLLPDTEGVRIRLDGVSCPAGDRTGRSPVFDLTIEAGERLALVGPIGGSASRLLDVLYGLRTPTHGHVTMDGLDLRQLQLDRMRDQFALVHGTEIVEGSVLDNLRFGRDHLDAAQIREALAKVELWDDVMALPEGLETELTTRGRPLSAVQASCLMLARAILGEPRLLLLDGALDRLPPALRQRVFARLFAPEHRWTVVVVTAMADVAAACDRTLDLAVAQDRAAPAADEGVVRG
ncbi:MAG: ABC transporter ATP-binding protein [Planctomycetes bacterium]|nr:ABC transporter ATP-binding protein [Planctomycetota bacterium]